MGSQELQSMKFFFLVSISMMCSNTHLRPNLSKRAVRFCDRSEPIRHFNILQKQSFGIQSVKAINCLSHQSVNQLSFSLSGRLSFSSSHSPALSSHRRHLAPRDRGNPRIGEFGQEIPARNTQIQIQTQIQIHKYKHVAGGAHAMCVEAEERVCEEGKRECGCLWM